MRLCHSRHPDFATYATFLIGIESKDSLFSAAVQLLKFKLRYEKCKISRRFRSKDLLFSLAFSAGELTIPLEYFPVKISTFSIFFCDSGFTFVS